MRTHVKKKTNRNKVSKNKSASKKASAKRSSGATKRAARPAPRRGRADRSIYFFAGGDADGDGSMKPLLGGKGANLAEMCRIGLPVPPGFTITTAVCARFNEARALPPGLMDEVRLAVAKLEERTGKGFGDAANPLLVSVRSGAAASMPGMMDTVLNLGLNDDAVAGLAERTGNPRFAFDAYRRLINMFGDVVMGVEHHHFEEAFDTVKRRYHADEDTAVSADGLAELCEAYKNVYRGRVGKPFPMDPYEQLRLAIEAVFRSWSTPRAVRYRQINNITGLAGTAVTVQAMVFGNTGDDSGTGVAFTRNPSTGEDALYGEFLVNAQGEDVVAGIRTPHPISELVAWNRAVHKQLLGVKATLEDHYRDMQDIEFTVEQGELFILQTRTGKRAGFAAVKIARDMVRQKRITVDEALARIPAGDVIQLLLPRFDESAKDIAEVLSKGLPASPGVAVGKPAFTAEEAVRRAAAGEHVILVRKETSPEDIDGMHSASGILTSTGGMTSHAAVVARGWGKCCVAGAGAVHIDAAQALFTIGERSFGREDVISLDGSTGEIMAGAVATRDPEISGDFAAVMKWADQRRCLRVRANADTPADARRAREFGAEGIGLCRTEHMFFDPERIDVMREMILAENADARRAALDSLMPFQRDDFVGIFTAMESLPVTVRLLDPPLHEFLPRDDAAQTRLAQRLGVPLAAVRQRVDALHETNPMLGHRGCRLAITYPEILEMQVASIAHAAIDCLEDGVRAKPEIMIPLVGVARELAVLRERAEGTIKRILTERGFKKKLDIPIGTMIEVPRACLTAGAIARHADFFSFGTNDLTQLTFGFSRDDVNTFLPDYLSQELLTRDPFQTIDRDGVGRLMKGAVYEGRPANPSLKIGVCGEHGGDPESVALFHEIGLEYISCSPYRVPIARLAAAQAEINF